MGTDIYMYAERRVDGQWRLLGPQENNPDYDPEENPKQPRLKPVEVYSNRNYFLFSMLADVRNFPDGPYRRTVINPPRGLPSDLSLELSSWASVSSAWDFSHASWLTLRELLAFDWQRVSAYPSHKYLEGKPIRGVTLTDPSGVKSFHVFPDEPLTKENLMEYLHLEQTIHATYEELVGPEFMDGVLKPLQEAGNPDDVRIVFWFV